MNRNFILYLTVLSVGSKSLMKPKMYLSLCSNTRGENKNELLKVLKFKISFNCEL